MKINFSSMQSFATMGSVRQSVKQNTLAQKFGTNAIPTQPNGSLPPEGHVNPFEDPYLNLTGKDPSEWQITVPVDEDVTAKLKALIKEDFVKRKGMCGRGSQADAQANIIKEYVKTLPGPQKLSSIYSCQKIAFAEANRLSSKIREQNPSWEYGQAFDTNIITKELDIKA